MNASERHNVTVTGRPDGQAMIFAHGFGCDQNMWRFVAPAFEDDFRVILFVHARAGGLDPPAYDPQLHGVLGGEAVDMLGKCWALCPRGVGFFVHSEFPMIRALADLA